METARNGPTSNGGPTEDSPGSSTWELRRANGIKRPTDGKMAATTKTDAETNTAPEATEYDPMILRRNTNNSDAANNNNNTKISSRHSMTVDQARRKHATSTRPAAQQQNMFEMNGESIGVQLEKMNRKISRQKRMIIKNIVAICVAYFLCFASFVGISIIQSSIVGAVGTIGLGVNFGCSIVGCVVLAPVLVRLIGCKYSMMIGFIGFLLWVLSNFYPVWGVVLPAAAVSGLCFGPLFAAQATYFAIQGEAYAKVTAEKADVVVTRLFGLFFCLLYLGASVGCLITSTILSAGNAATIPGLDNSTVVVKTEDPGPRPHCGANFCPGAPPPAPPSPSSPLPSAAPLATAAPGLLVLGEQVLNMTVYGVQTNVTSDVDISARPLISKTKVLVLVGTHSALMLLGFIIVTFVVDQIPKDDGTGDGSVLNEAKRSVMGMLTQLKRPRQILMTPLNIYTGFSQSFVLADITGAFIACAMGFGVLGYTLATWGAAACLTSILCSLLMRRVGRIPFFTIAFIIRLGIMIFLILWIPDSSMPYWFFIIPGVWAIGDGFLISQLNAVYGIFFADNAEGAFSTYRFYESIGMVLGYGLNSVLCVKYKLYVLIGLFSVGVIGYYITERRQQLREEARRKLSAGRPRRRSEILVESFLEVAS